MKLFFLPQPYETSATHIQRHRARRTGSTLDAARLAVDDAKGPKTTARRVQTKRRRSQQVFSSTQLSALCLRIAYIRDTWRVHGLCLNSQLTAHRPRRSPESSRHLDRPFNRDRCSGHTRTNKTITYPGVRAHPPTALLGKSFRRRRRESIRGFSTFSGPNFLFVPRQRSKVSGPSRPQLQVRTFSKYKIKLN